MQTVEVAKDIVFLCRKYNHEFNNTKVQKLLYLFIGFCLQNDIEAIKNIDELPQVWQYGPVFPKVYENYPSFNVEPQHSLSIQDPKTLEILEKTVKLWGRATAGKLSDWSHKSDSPWSFIKNNKGFKTDIPLDIIYNYFAEKVENVLEEDSETGIFNFIKKIFA